MANASPAGFESSVPNGDPRESRPSGIKPQERFYLPELDITRFIAFLWMFYIHISISFPATDTTQWPRILWTGFYTIDLFFTMSAYLIAQLLIREIERRGAVNVRAFYIRRALRIWPLYFFFVTVALMLSMGFRGTQYASSFWVPPAYFIAFVFFVGNFVFAKYSSPVLVVTMLWTLSIEEQVYLMFPWLIRKASPRMVVLTGGALVAIANLARIHFAYNYSSGVPVWFNTFTHLDAIGYGIMLAAVPREWFLRLAPIHRIALLALGIGCWFFGDNLYNPLIAADYPFQEVASYAVAMLGCGIILVAVLGIFKGDIQHPLMRFFSYGGRISYGLYVYHGLALTLTLLFCSAITLRQPTDSLSVQILRQLAAAIISLSLSFAMAAVSYRWLETPFLKLKGRFTVVESRPV